MDAHLPLFRRAALLGLSIGVAGMVVERATSAVLGSGSSADVGGRAGWALLGDLAFAYGSTALALGYGAAIVLVARSARFRGLTRPLGPVGRLALTVYITQTLAFTTVFYGYGFGQAFRLGPAAVTAIAIVIFVAQVIACSWWVRRFQLGPLEWLWRALTYLRAPPMRRVVGRA